MENLIFNKTGNRQSNGVTTRKIVMLICFIAITCASFAQDVIVTKDSKSIEAKVVEVNVDNIKYRQFDNIEGPLYTILKSDVVSITFQNGLTQTFVTQTPAQTTQAYPPHTTEDLLLPKKCMKCKSIIRHCIRNITQGVG